MQGGLVKHGRTQDQASNAGDGRIETERIPNIDARGGPKIVVAGNGAGRGLEGFFRNTRDYVLGLPWLASEDAGIGNNEVGFVFDVAAGGASAAELEKEPVEAGDDLIVSAHRLEQGGVVEGNHEGVLVAIALFEALLIRTVAFGHGALGIESGQPGAIAKAGSESWPAGRAKPGRSAMRNRKPKHRTEMRRRRSASLIQARFGCFRMIPTPSSRSQDEEWRSRATEVKTGGRKMPVRISAGQSMGSESEVLFFH
jgi:hypothetical protein